MTSAKRNMFALIGLAGFIMVGLSVQESTPTAPVATASDKKPDKDTPDEDSKKRTKEDIKKDLLYAKRFEEEDDAPPPKRACTAKCIWRKVPGRDNLLIRDVHGEGNCLFTSLVVALNKVENPDNDMPQKEEELRMKEARKGIVEYMKKHKDIFNESTIGEKNINQYFEKMAKDKTWGGDPEVHAFGLWKNVKVRFYENVKGVVSNEKIYGATDSKKTICVFYSGKNHYQAIYDTDTRK